MKKIFLIIAMAAVASYSYCEYGSLTGCSIVGGHYEGVYNFPGHGYVTFTFGSWCPSSIRYDFWSGRVCR